MALHNVDSLNYVFPSGKHKGTSLKDALIADPKYIAALLEGGVWAFTDEIAQVISEILQFASTREREQFLEAKEEVTFYQASDELMSNIMLYGLRHQLDMEHLFIECDEYMDSVLEERPFLPCSEITFRYLSDLLERMGCNLSQLKYTEEEQKKIVYSVIDHLERDHFTGSVIRTDEGETFEIEHFASYEENEKAYLSFPLRIRRENGVCYMSYGNLLYTDPEKNYTLPQERDRGYIVHGAFIWQEHTGKVQEYLDRQLEDETREISAAALMVIQNKFRCTKNHEIEEVKGLLNVTDKFGRIRPIEFSVGYCRTCDVYFIHRDIYGEILRYGIPQAQICEGEVYEKNGGRLESNDLNADSPLSRAGYSVAQNRGLSEEQRDTILATLVDQDVLTKSRIIDYLQYFISMNGRRPNMENAVEKWRKDIQFLNHYQPGSLRSVRVSKIIL